MAFLNKLPEMVEIVRRATEEALRELIKQDSTLAANAASFRPQELKDGDVLNSAEFNYEQTALFLMLRSIYAQVTEIDATRRRHENIINESFTRSRATLLKALNDLRSFAFLQQFPEFDDVKFIDFNAARNLSERAPLADVDTSSRSTRLAVASRQEARINRPNADAKIEIAHKGAGDIKSMVQDFNPSRMLDGDDGTYWADLVVADGPIVQSYTDSRSKTRTMYGLVTEVVVHLAEASRVNNLRLLPFGEYPIGVIDVAYKESESSDNWKPLPDFVEGDPSLDWVEVSFSPVQASVIRVTLNQKNFEQGIYHLPANMVNTTNLLEHAIADAYKDRVGTSAISDPQVAQVAAFPELLGLLESIDEFDLEVTRSNLPEERVREHELSEGVLRAMARVLARPDISLARDMLEPAGIQVEAEREKLLKVKTTEYLVGLRELQAAYITYVPVSYYASPKFSTTRTPVEVSVVANEVHPSFSDANGTHRLTGIDYEFDFGEGLRIPIHPINYDKVKDEFVYVDRHTKVGYTRHLPSSLSVSLRRNGVLVPAIDYTFVIDTTLNLGKLIVVNKYASTAVYSLTYTPNDEATRIELPAVISSTPVRVPESFDGTDDTNRVATKYIPHIAWGVVNDEDNFEKRAGEGVWEFIGTANVTVDGVTYSTDNPVYEPMVVLVNNVKATNITNYDSAAQPLFTEVDPASKRFQYFHVGNYVYFNAPVDRKQITVQYNWLVQHVQLISTLRTFKQAGVDVTPKMVDFRIQVRTSPL